MPDKAKISLIYNLLNDEPTIQKNLINSFKTVSPFGEEYRLACWVKDNIPQIPTNEKSVKIYSVITDKSEEEIKEYMEQKQNNPKITIKNNTNIHNQYGFVFKRNIWNTTYEQYIISDGVGNLTDFNSYIVIDFQGTASYIVRELWQDKKLLEREILSSGKWQELPLYHNLYTIDNIKPDEVDYTLKGQKKLTMNMKGMIKWKK